MRFGTAKVITTPPFKMKLSCSGKMDVDYEDVYDDVYARCLVFENGDRRLVLMSFDLLFHDRSLNDAIAEYANEKYGIAKEAVCVCYTHAHTTPASKGYHPLHHDDRYEELLIERGKECLDCAMASMFEGYYEYGSTEIEMNDSRRACIDGHYQNRPDPNKPHDKELFVITVCDTDDKIRSVLVNYACHPVFYPAPLTLCGEFPARLCRELDAKYEGCVSLFAQSAGGDVRPRPVAVPLEDGTWKWRAGTFEEMEKFGTDLALLAQDLINSGNMKRGAAIFSAVQFEIPLEMHGRSLADFEKLWERWKDDRYGPNRTNAYLISHGGYEKLSDVLMLSCQIFCVNKQFYIATMGGEPCYNVKQIVREVFGDRTLCFVGYTDACAYIVDDVMIDEGGYEPTSSLEYGLKGNFKRGISQSIRQGFTDALTTILNEQEEK